MIKQNYRTYLLEAIFILISIVYGSAYLFFLKQGLSGDGFFHYLSYKDVFLTLIHGSWPQFNLHSGYLLGSATNTFYPWLLFLPIILFINLIPPLQWWGLAISLGMFIGLNVTQWVGKQWLHSKKAGLYLSIFYCLSTIPFSEIYSQGDLNSFYAMMVTPLALYGWHQWLIHNNWLLMTISLSLIIYLHVLTAEILILSFIILTILQFRSLTIIKIWTGCKSAFFVLCLTAFYWVPVLVLYKSNNLFLPSAHGTFYMHTQIPFFNWISLVSPLAANMWNIITIISVFVIVLHYKSISQRAWSYIILCFLFLLANNYTICVWLMRHTALSTLQFTHRLCFITIFYFSLILLKLGHQNVIHFKRYAYIIILTLASFLFIGLQEQIKIGNTQSATQSVTQSWHLRKRPLAYTSHELRTTRFLRALPQRYPDYYPNNLVHINSKKSSSTKRIVPVLRAVSTQYSSLHQNELIMHSNCARHVSLPIATYHQQHYHMYNNRHLSHWSSHRSLLHCRIHKGTNHIQIKTPVMWYRYVTIIISVGTLLVLLFKRRND